MSRSTMFMSSDAAAAAERVVCEAEDFGDFESAFIEEVILELQEYLKGMNCE